jgi:hypothetical protein
MMLAKADVDALVRAGATKVLHRAWQPELGYCRPNRRSYPHLWLWDSCFHSIAWSALHDERAVRELDAVFDGQLPNGFLPHMRYGRRTYPRGPLPTVSSFTQPPVYARALQAATQAGLAASPRLFEQAEAALDALWRLRMRDGLLVIVHPWEAGTDDSPRWDSWIGSTSWRRRLWTKVDRQLLESTVFSPDGPAIDNPEFVVAPASFNAIAADAAATLGDLLDDEAWRTRARDLADALDERAWDDEEQLWSDVAFVGPPVADSVRVPTSDAVLPTLCTADRSKADKALAQLTRPDRFAATYGPRFVPPDHPAYRPDEYWRGPAWPQLNYLTALAAKRCDLTALAADLATTTKRSVLRAGFSEYWNPETGRGLGAIPQTWAAVAAAL